MINVGDIFGIEISRDVCSPFYFLALRINAHGIIGVSMTSAVNSLTAKLAKGRALPIGKTLVRRAAIESRVGPVAAMRVHWASTNFRCLCGADVDGPCPLRGVATAPESA
jgi:hypothetical protein